MKTPRTPEQKAAEREAARKKRGVPMPRNRYNEARSVACQQMGLRYKPVLAPTSNLQLLAHWCPRGDDDNGEKIHPHDRMLQLTTGTSWEIMTERMTG